MLEKIVVVFIVLLVERTHIYTFPLQSEANTPKMQLVLLDYLVHLSSPSKSLKDTQITQRKEMKDHFKKKAICIIIPTGGLDAKGQIDCTF